RDKLVTGVQTCALPIYYPSNSTTQYVLSVVQKNGKTIAQVRGPDANGVQSVTLLTAASFSTKAEANHLEALVAAAVKYADALKRSEERRVGKGAGTRRG